MFQSIRLVGAVRIEPTTFGANTVVPNQIVLYGLVRRETAPQNKRVKTGQFKIRLLQKLESQLFTTYRGAGQEIVSVDQRAADAVSFELSSSDRVRCR